MTEDFTAAERAMLEVLDAIPLAVFVKDAGGRIVLMNRACQSQWGMTLDEMRGTDGSGHFPPEQVAAFLARDREVFANGVAVDFLETFRSVAHGADRIGRTFKQPVYDGQGKPRFIVGAVIDVTESVRAEQVLRASEEKLRALFEMSPLGIARNAMDGTFLEANAAFLQIVGHTLDGLNRLTYWDLTPKEYEAEEARQLESLRTTGRYGPYQKEYIHGGGRRVPVELRGMLVTGTDGGKSIWSIVEDITERRRVDAELQLAAQVFRNTSEGMLVSDSRNRIVAINPAFTRMTGYTLDEIAGRDPSMFKSGHHDAAFYREMWQSLRQTGSWQGELWDRRKNGEVKANRLSINVIYDEDGAVQRYVALFSDITDRKRSEETIWRQANFDALTGLPNRRMFLDRLEQALLKSRRDGGQVALFIIDLDHFKEVNDTLGHPLGDLLLKEAARRLTDCVRRSDTVARLGGDEFAVVLGNAIDGPHVETVARKIIEVFAEPFLLGEERSYVSASIGITVCPDDAQTADAMVKNADQAMYEAKHKGRHRFSYYTPALQEAAQHRLRIINDLRPALAAGQFLVHYQPIVALATGRVDKAEALLRWRHPVRGMVSPAEFIPLAEESGVIAAIGDWVFREAARWAGRWARSRPDGFQVSINLSPAQFKGDEPLQDAWRDHLAALRLDGRHIVVEITEGLLMHADADAQRKLLEFRDAGVQVAIDDFGTGYSALAYLKRFDIDYLKLDQSFVRDIATDPDDMALSEAIVVMAHKLGLKVIAEGVETAQQRDLLSAIGCDYGQGYLFARPMGPEQLEAEFVIPGTGGPGAS